ncbi:hypothetical protein GYB73_21315 [Sinorhizobium meliloti]|nr:hypothetical protein [Sinorhizobium meliloti]
MSNYISNDEPREYRADNTTLGQAMMRAQAAEQEARQAKMEALAIEAKEQAVQAEIARATELSVANNPQLQAQRMGFTNNRMVSSRDVGMIAPPEIVNQTNVKFNGIEISAQQAKDMVTYGQWSEGEYRKALSEALALHGYKAPGSFR